MNSPTDWRSLYPFESHYFDLGELRYHYVDEGSGEPLLMVHGNPTWSFYWRNLVSAFRDRHRVVAVDNIGCGLSDKPTDYAYRLAQHISNLAELVEALDLKDITLVVHDWGGPIGLGAALKAPERYARLVILNTAAFPPPYVPFRIRACRTPLIGRLVVQGGNFFARSALAMAVERPQNWTDAAKAGMLAPYDSWSNRTAVYRFVCDIPLTRQHPTWQTLEDIEQGLPALADRPVQFVWGMRDWCFTPECLQRMLKSLPDAEVHRIDDAGHYVVEDACDDVSSTIEQFIAKRPLVPAKG